MKTGLFFLTAALFFSGSCSTSIFDPPEKQSGNRTMDIAFWTAHSTRKILQKDARPDQARLEMHICSAKNEFEAIQIIATPRKSIANLRIHIGNFTGGLFRKISRENIEIRYSCYVPIPDKNTHYPDPLPPLDKIDLSPGINQPIFIIVKVPADADAGQYSSPVTIKWDGGEYKSHLHLTVWDFALPDAPRCVTSFGCWGDFAVKAHGLAPGTPEASLLNRKYYEMLLDYKISAFDIPAPYDSPEAAKYFLDPRMTSYKIPEFEKDDAQLKRIVEILKKNDWWDKGYFYLVDEPNNREQYDLMHQRAERVRKIAPDARIIGTFCGRPQFDASKTFVPYAEKDVNLWCIVSSLYMDDKDVHGEVWEQHQKGDDLWWYVCCGPGHPYCNFFVDMAGMQHRMLFWQQKMNKVDGLLYWNAIFWNEDSNVGSPDPWSDIDTFKPANPSPYGDGSLFYPGKKIGLDEPVPSQRLLNIRDGIEDYDYLCLIEEKYGEKEARGNIGRLVKSMTEYSTDYLELEKIRKEMAEKLSE
ncbi:DUF4091 domain-containing protein [Candidatus Sumerlaeota bacterium]|nr:DUF4091 domain-containing protein [Candidatus Sumerlaeota bacterium]